MVSESFIKYNAKDHEGEIQKIYDKFLDIRESVLMIEQSENMAKDSCIALINYHVAAARFISNYLLIVHSLNNLTRDTAENLMKHIDKLTIQALTNYISADINEMDKIADNFANYF